MEFVDQFNKGTLWWIYKPGEATNRGRGIKIFNSLSKIRQHIEEELREKNRYSSFLLQKYIVNPLLIERRKFDIRVFAVFVAHAETGVVRGYFYNEGYLRTSCKEYSMS